MLPELVTPSSVHRLLNLGHPGPIHLWWIHVHMFFLFYTYYLLVKSSLVFLSSYCCCCFWQAYCYKEICQNLVNIVIHSFCLSTQCLYDNVCFAVLHHINACNCNIDPDLPRFEITTIRSLVKSLSMWVSTIPNKILMLCQCHHVHPKHNIYHCLPFFFFTYPAFLLKISQNQVSWLSDVNWPWSWSVDCFPFTCIHLLYVCDNKESTDNISLL